MDIYAILKTKSHNPHYLKRYYTFIMACLANNEENNRTKDNCYMEEHHFLPKAKDFWPEYTSLYKNKWNKATLTARQHFIAHIILWKAYPNYSSMREALWCMLHMKNAGTKLRYDKLDSKTYSKVKEEISNSRKVPHSPERRLITSIALKKKYAQEKHHSIGSKRSDEAKANTSKTLKINYSLMSLEERREKFGHSGEKNGMWGNTQTPEGKAKIGLNTKSQPRICCITCKTNKEQGIPIYIFSRSHQDVEVCLKRAAYLNEIRYCLNCGIEITTQKFCSVSCTVKYTHKKKKLVDISNLELD